MRLRAALLPCLARLPLLGSALRTAGPLAREPLADAPAESDLGTAEGRALYATRAVRAWWGDLQSEVRAGDGGPAGSQGAPDVAETALHQEEGPAAESVALARPEERSSEEEDPGWAPSCSAHDGDELAGFLSEFGNKLLAYGEKLSDAYDEDGVERDLVHYLDRIGMPSLLSTKPLGSKFMAVTWSVMYEVLQLLPKGCRSISAWLQSDAAQAVKCVRRGVNVTRPCAKCIPKFVRDLGRDCQAQCFMAMKTYSDNIAPKVQPMIDDLVGLSVLGPSQTQIMQGKLAAMGTEASKLLKVYVPCVKCLHNRIATFGRCVGVDKDVMELLNVMLNTVQESMRNGTLTSVMTVRVSESESTLPRA